MLAQGPHRRGVASQGDGAQGAGLRTGAQPASSGLRLSPPPQERGGSRSARCPVRDAVPECQRSARTYFGVLSGSPAPAARSRDMTAPISCSSASKSSTSTSRNVSTVLLPERTETRSSATSARRASAGDEIDGVPVGDQAGRPGAASTSPTTARITSTAASGGRSGRPREVGLLARHGVADHASTGLERPLARLSPGALRWRRPSLACSSVEVIGVPVRRRQLDGAAVHGARALDDLVEVGKNEVHVDRDLDLAFLGHRHHSRAVRGTPRTRATRRPSGGEVRPRAGGTFPSPRRPRRRREGERGPRCAARDAASRVIRPSTRKLRPDRRGAAVADLEATGDHPVTMQRRAPTHDVVEHGADEAAVREAGKPGVVIAGRPVREDAVAVQLVLQMQPATGCAGRAPSSAETRCDR